MSKREHFWNKKKNFHFTSKALFVLEIIKVTLYIHCMSVCRLSFEDNWHNRGKKNCEKSEHWKRVSNKSLKEQKILYHHPKRRKQTNTSNEKFIALKKEKEKKAKKNLTRFALNLCQLNWGCVPLLIIWIFLHLLFIKEVAVQTA